MKGTVLCMEKTKVYFKNFIGTSYEVGTEIGQWVLSTPSLLKQVLLPPNAYPNDKFTKITDLLDRYCQGINEEIKGFADTIGVSSEQALFYTMTYLERGCSLMAVLPSKSKSGHTLMARNYDFNNEMEEMCFAFTNIKGKYRYIGSTLNLFGRCDGMNEHGLAVCKASNGVPVGNFEGGQKAGATGFSFWVVVRSILENCKTVQEAIEWTMSAPIGYNMNLMLADSSNKIALLQCMDGHKSYKLLDEYSEEAFLSVTNHAVLEDIKPYQKMIIENSVVRNNKIVEVFTGKKQLSKKDMKTLLSTSYPDGLCCHYYKEFFGTLRSMIFDVNDKTIEMTFGSPQVNEWQTFSVGALEMQEVEVLLPQEKARPDFYKIS
ncbi:C45 family autoproteolytic acyltransferase/hydolase [Paenibacillus riograndensis]|nr:C45 family peptidase [Paenibacillus riograndensis]